MDWFRFYSEAVNDKKLRRVARMTGQTYASVLGIWTILLSMASESPERGRLLIGHNIPATDEDIADIAGCNVTETLQQLEETGLVTRYDGVLSITAWDKRQYESDSSAERVAKHRQKVKEAAEAAKKAEKTPDVTDTKRYSSVIVTPPDTDTDINTSAAHAGANAPSAPAAHVSARPETTVDPLTTCLRQLADPDTRNKNAPIGALFRARFGEQARPDYGRLGKMAKELSGEHTTLAKIIWKCGVPEGDAHDYLAKAVRASPAHLNGTRPKNRDEDRELARADGFAFVDEEH